MSRACVISMILHAMAICAMAITWSTATSIDDRSRTLMTSVMAPREASGELRLDSLKTDTGGSEQGDELVSKSALVENARVTLAMGDVFGASEGETMMARGSGFGMEFGDALEDAMGTPENGEATFYGASAKGNDFVFVVDRSGSMRRGRLTRACKELKRSLRTLSPDQRFYVIFFSSDARPMPAAGLINATPENLDEMCEWIDNVGTQGGTFPLEALMASLALSPDAIFFLTDGEFSDQVPAQIRQGPSSGDPIPIHCISFVSRAGKPMLKSIAGQSGGTYRHVR